MRPPEGTTFAAEKNVIVGNTVLYGATKGRAFFRGLAGERFAVRNSGADAVVEGVGDHGCEYMTGGRVVVLGRTGRNFAAGMSGGIAYVLDEDGGFERPLQHGARRLRPARGRRRRGRCARWSRSTRERTGSPVAARVLDDWDELLPRFVKVMPHDYKRALAELAAENETRLLPRRPSDLEPRRGLRDHRVRGARAGARRPPNGRAGRFLKLARVETLERDPGERVARLPRVRRAAARSPSCASRARAAWSAACRSATTAARSTT